MACSLCGSKNVKCTIRGAVFDDYRCNDCGHYFARMNGSAKRLAIIGSVTALTGGLDLGFLGNLASLLIGDS